jgi:hypothetical protein
MWVKFKTYWQDGLYKYDPGKVVELPTSLAMGYIQSGKAVKTEAPDWAMEDVPKGKKKKTYPSARRRIKKVSSNPNDPGMSEIAGAEFDED